MLTLVGLRDGEEFRTVNRQQNGKIFETFFLRMEMFRRVFQHTQLRIKEVDSLLADYYPSVTYQQKCEGFGR